MPRVDLSELPCTVAKTLEIVGDRWTLMILRDAFYGLERFDEFTEDLGISRNILTDRLKRLVAAEVMTKVPYQERPTRYAYKLTDKGRDLIGVILAMMAWGDRWESAATAPPVSLRHRTCQHKDITPQVCCSACGEELRLSEVSARPLPVLVPDGRRVALASSPGPA